MKIMTMIMNTATCVNTAGNVAVNSQASSLSSSASLFGSTSVLQAVSLVKVVSRVKYSHTQLLRLGSILAVSSATAELHRRQINYFV